MCNSSSCEYNKAGVGADFLCRCKYVRFDYRKACSRNFSMLFAVPDSLNPAHVWDIIAEYFTHK